MPAEQEASLLIRAVCSIKLPSLIFEDTARFTALLGDLFPGVTISGAQDTALEAAVLKVAADMHLTLTSTQVGGVTMCTGARCRPQGSCDQDMSSINFWARR